MERIRKNIYVKNKLKKEFQAQRFIKTLQKWYFYCFNDRSKGFEGIKCDFFNKEAYTTTIPAQFIKKFNSKVVPIY